jgi:multiple sugar transport system ATP-binding protein
MVFQQNVLYPHLTVYGNMAFGLWLRGEAFGFWSRFFGRLRKLKGAQGRDRHEDASRRVRQTARMLGIEGLLGRWPHELSGGERQRVALGRALARRPAAFLLDEPLSNLDAARRTYLSRELKRLHRRFSTTTVLVTHDQSEALSLGDRVAVMGCGTIEQIGPPMAIYDRPRNRFVAGFIGTPPMNFLEGELAEREGNLEYAAYGHSIALPPQMRPALLVSGRRSAVVGVRPEDVVLHGGVAAPGSRAILGRVVSVEPLGGGDCVQVEIAAQAGFAAAARPLVAARTDRNAGWRVGDRTIVEFDTRRLHVFDGATGENLALASRQDAAGPGG